MILNMANFIINIDNVEVMKVRATNDYLTLCILKKEKFSWKEYKLNEKFASLEHFMKNYTNKFISIKNDTYVNIAKIMFIEKIEVPNTINTLDLKIHLISGEPFVIRANSSTYDLMVRRLREG